MKTRRFAVSIQADDEFNVKLALESELDDVTPRDGLAGLVIARHRKGRRRRVAGVFGLFVVFAGIGVPIGVAGTSGGTPARPGPVALRLGSYTLTLPDRYRLSDADAPACAAAAIPGPRRLDAAQAATAPGVCVLMFLTPSFGPRQADPNVPRGAAQVTVGHGRAWLVPRAHGGVTLVVAEGMAGGQVRDLVIGASGLSRAALVSLVSAGLRAA
jgi:hypothetical protein